MASKPRWRWGVYGVLGVFAVLGLVPLWEIVGWWVLVGVAGAVVLVLLRKLSEFCGSLAEVLGAVVVPWLCLLGFNLIWRWVFGAIRPSLELGLVIAGLVFLAAATGYLAVWREKKLAAPVVALVLAGANVVGVPLLLVAPHREAVVAAPQPVASRLDVAIVVPSTSREPLPPAATARPPADWDVRYSVARAGPVTFDWLLLDSPDPQAAQVAARGSGTPVPGSPARRTTADQVVVLDVDGTPPVTADPAALPSVPGTKREVTRWLRIARRVSPQATVAVLLQTKDPQRLAAWARRVEPGGGSVASIQRLGATTLTDAAVALASQAPSTSEDLALALRFRPVLLFDDGETLNTPLNVEDFLRSGRVQLCHDDRLTGSSCDPVSRSSDLISGSTHLRIRRRRPADPQPPSAIYVHPTSIKEGERDLLFLDYWWYLDGNPAAVGKGTSCGVGLAIPGKTCFDHDSDWEGMTVVVDREGDEAVPVAVQYAEHSDVVRYDFRQLRAYWTDRRRHDPRWRQPRLRGRLARIDDLELRPLAFVARGTHATYRDLCPSRCRQVAKGLTENPHDGLRSWPGNETADCIATSCLRLLPTRHGGRDPALWNAYEGVWGERRCILRGAYCTAEESPAAPATQGRYKHPTRISGHVDARSRFHRCGGEPSSCPPPP